MEALIIPVMAFLNRMRGSGWFDYNRPIGISLFGVAVFLFTWDPLVAAIVFLGAFPDFWLSWGSFIDLGRGPWGEGEKRWDHWYVHLIEKLSGGNNYIGLFLRRLFIIPMFVASVYFGYLDAFVAGFLTITHATLMVLSYHIGWWVKDNLKVSDGIEVGEWVSGAFFGLILMFVIF